MSELKPRIMENGIDYILVGDYYIPDLKLPEEHRSIGKYGRMHREYLREVHPARLTTPHTPRPAPSATTRVCKVVIAEAKNSIYPPFLRDCPGHEKSHPFGRQVATSGHFVQK